MLILLSLGQTTTVYKEVILGCDLTRSDMAENIADRTKAGVAEDPSRIHPTVSIPFKSILNKSLEVGAPISEDHLNCLRNREVAYQLLVPLPTSTSRYKMLFIARVSNVAATNRATAQQTFLNPTPELEIQSCRYPPNILIAQSL